MWNSISKTRRLLILGAALIAASSFLVFPMIAGAGPSSTPTGGNVDANFDSITSTDVTATGDFILPAGSSTSSAGILYKGTATFLHNYGSSNNLFLGYGAGNLSMTGIAQNTGIGYWALKDNTTGSQNTAIGSEALENNTTGTNNTAIGTMSMYAGINTGSFNTAVGKESAYRNTGGGNNTAIGYGSLHENTSGSNNTALGASAGRITTGSGNVFIGNQAGYNETGSNQLYIDNSNTADPLIYGNLASNQVGINTGSPSADLHVLNTDGSNSFRVDDAMGDTTPFIVNADGRVGIGTTAPSKKLHVVDGDGSMTYGDTSGVQVYNSEGSAGEVRLGAAWGRPGVYSTNNLNLLAASGLALSGRGNNSDMYLNTSGNVGIGTTTPGVKLHTYDAGINELRVEGGTTAQFKLQDNDNGDSYWLHNNGDRLYFLWNGGAGGAGWNGDRPITIWGNKVGIGTASPVTDLTVTGSTGVRITTGEHPNVFGDIYNKMSGDPDGGLNINSQTGGSWADIRFKTNGVERMILESAGNLGIGTLAPAARLHVEDPANNVVGTFGGFGIGVTAIGDGGGGLFDDANSSGQVKLANDHVGVTAHGNVYGGYFSDNSNPISETSKVTIGGNNYGIRAGGNDYGGYFYDNNGGTGTAYLGYGLRGIEAYGTNMAGYFQNSSTSNYAQVATGTTGIVAYGNTQGGYFRDLTQSGYARIGTGDTGVMGYGNSMGGYFTDSNSGGYYARVGYSSYGIYSNGYLYGSTGASSDIRLKKDIKPLNNSLAKIMQLEPVEFEYKAPDSIPGKQLGFIAQDAEKVIPELVMKPDFSNCSLTPEEIENSEEPLVNECPGAYYGFKYGQMSPLLTEAIQELKSEKDNEVAELKEEIAALRGVVCELKPEINICD